jgi:hypothetical protein
MTKIADVIKLKTGYANFVELKSAFEATQENADRMDMYRPTKAHRDAFQRICRGLTHPNDKKFYLLSGSYGTGKSHLCLMTANVLSRSSGDPEIVGFHENYSKLDPDRGRVLKNIRKDGQYLVAICDYHAGRQFQDVVMKAIFEACEAKGMDPGVITEFDEAERQLDEWESQGNQGGLRDFYQDFKKTLENISPGLTVDQLRVKLKEYDSKLLELFREAFLKVTGGVEFQAQAGNLIPIIKKLVKSPTFKERFKGLAIFFDEFGETLGEARYSKSILQGFMESLCKQEPNVLFIGCIHKDFKAYADQFSQADAAVMSARLTQVDLLNEGIEEIISAIVEIDKQSSTWKSEIGPKTLVFDQLVPTCKSLNLFPWIEDINHIRERVLEDIYGVHPMALSCLLKLSSEIGSDTRSTFTFFTGDVDDKKGSYAEFIKSADLTLPAGQLNMYTTPQLFTFFSKELSQSNPELREGQRQSVNGYYASLDALRKAAEGELLGFHEDKRIDVLKTILIYQLCQIPADLETIQFGLYCLSGSDKSQVKAYLKEMDKSGAVFFRQQSKTYELAASSGEDPYAMIERFKSNQKLHPNDMVAAFIEEGSGGRVTEFSEAKGYNLSFTEDKRFKTHFVRGKDLSDNLWDEYQQENEDNLNKPGKSYEGTLVYALCETEGDINLVKEAIKTIKEKNIIVAIPHSPQPFSDLLLKVKACRHFLPPHEAEKISAQTESRLRSMLENTVDGYLDLLKRKYQSVVAGDEAGWFGEAGDILVDRPKQSHIPADMLCEKLFTQHSRIKHADLNLSHDEKWRLGKNPALKQAINGLLKVEKIMIDNGNPDNHGEKRYLEKVLLKGAGALKKTESAGSANYFVCETDADKIHTDFPVLKELFSRLAKLNPGQSFSVGAYLTEVSRPPYGAGGTTLMLTIAHLLRAYGERLVLYKDSTMMIELSIQDYEELAQLIADPVPKSVLMIRNISAVQEKLVEIAALTVGAQPLKHGETRSLNSAYDHLNDWWRNLPTVAKIVGLYSKDQAAHLTTLKNVLDGMNSSTDRFDFILEQIPTVYGDASLSDAKVTKIGESFSADVKLLNSGEHLAQSQVASAVCKLFGGQGDLIECEKVVSKWYKNLNSNQREPFRYDNEEAKQLLIHMADQSLSFGDKIFSKLPSDYHFGTLKEWTALRVQDYMSLFKQAKSEIEAAKTVVPKPNIKEGVLEVRDKDKVTVDVPVGASQIIYTIDGTDPKQSDTAMTTETPINLSALLKGRSNLKVQLLAVDTEGNKSDTVNAEIVSKERKFEIQMEADFFGEKATFKWPEDRDDLFIVLKSVLQYGLEKGLINEADLKKVDSALTEMQKNN